MNEVAVQAAAREGNRLARALTIRQRRRDF
jgi:hypothetical protein